MKKLTITIASLLLTAQLFAQAPQKMSYQAVIRNTSNSLVMNAPVGMRISILSGSATGTPVYVETQTPSTNANGLVSLKIGNGTVVSGSLAAIDWSTGSYFIKTESDLNGGSNYSVTGSTELLSVPYALYAENSGTPGPQGPQGIQGPQGEIGLTGPQGIQGDTGLQGATGDTGAQGLQGIQGVTGTGIVSTVDNGNGTFTLNFSDNTSFTTIDLRGATGAAGTQGVQGEIGAQGNQGSQGVQGPIGLPGTNGVDGKTVLNGTSNPAVGTGANGDFYINTATSTLFGPKASGAWPSGVSLVGATGPAGLQGTQGNQGSQGVQGPIGSPGTNGVDGKTVLNGTSNPAVGTGANGDFYINTATSTLFGPKASGAWPSGVSLVGATGPAGLQGAQGNQGSQGVQGPIGLPGTNGVDGRTVLNGTSNPAVGTGANGDFYINTATSTLFGPKASGTWPSGVSLVGATGPAGLQGTQGVQGNQGAVGANGQGVPTGGATGQVLAKVNGTDYNTQWVNATGQTAGTVAGQMQYWNGTAWITVAVGNEGQILRFVGGVPTWTTVVGLVTLGSTDVYNPSTGKIWMDRNLGASQVATGSQDNSAFGHLYQWGRVPDGHQIRTSGTTSTLSNTSIPGNSNFILAPNSPYDWQSSQNANLWQGVNDFSNPCPGGYRLPTEAEWDAERQSWNSNNSAGAFMSPLKLTIAGNRIYFNGNLDQVNVVGGYWSSTVSGIYSRYLVFDSSNALISVDFRARGLSVRCIRN